MRHGHPDIPQPNTGPAWSNRCDCRNEHNSSSGRCNTQHVTDPTRHKGEPAYCVMCRVNCGHGQGSRPVSAAMLDRAMQEEC